MHVVMIVIGVPPIHIQQGSKVVLGKTPAKIAVIGFLPRMQSMLSGAIPDKVMVSGIPPWYAQFMMPNPFNMLLEPVAGESHDILVKFLWYPGK